MHQKVAFLYTTFSQGLVHMVQEMCHALGFSAYYIMGFAYVEKGLLQLLGPGKKRNSHHPEGHGSSKVVLHTSSISNI